MTSFFPKGEPQSAADFTGTVFANIMVKPADELNSTVGKVTFELGARTNWHSHGPGQILLVTEGVGYYQAQGKPAQIIRPGDVVKIPARVVHWHGASHDSSLTHLATVASAGPDGATWLQPVTEAEYDAARP